MYDLWSLVAGHAGQEAGNFGEHHETVRHAEMPGTGIIRCQREVFKRGSKPAAHLASRIQRAPVEAAFKTPKSERGLRPTDDSCSCLAIGSQPPASR